MILLAGATSSCPIACSARKPAHRRGRIVAIDARDLGEVSGASRVDLAGSFIVPGFVDVHVHGVEGHDVLDGPGAVGEVAARLPKYGVTAFCPTSIACDPATLERLLADTGSAQAGTDDSSLPAARVVAAHLESNFINPEYNGAQPIECLRSARWSSTNEGAFTGQEILDTIERHRAAVGIVTVAPEIEGGLDLVRRLAAQRPPRLDRPHRRDLRADARGHRRRRDARDASVQPHVADDASCAGRAGAVLESSSVGAEVICDGFHVHPSLVALAIRAKGRIGVMAITDGTAGSGLPVGARATIGGRPIVVTERTAELEDGTLAGSVLTMDGAFRMLVRDAGASLIEAAPDVRDDARRAGGAYRHRAHCRRHRRRSRGARRPAAGSSRPISWAGSGASAGT